MEASGVQQNVLALTDKIVLRLGEVLNALRTVNEKGISQIDPLMMTQALQLSNYFCCICSFYIHWYLV